MAEIKSMQDSLRHLRKGVAQTLLDYIIGEAGRRGYRRLSLETGWYRRSSRQISSARGVVSPSANLSPITWRIRTASS